jgi:hypothetical protein
MKTRPILFTGPMVRALLDGTKTQTRRIVKPQPEYGRADCDNANAFRVRLKSGGWHHCDPITFAEIYSPYGQPGDRLWVRETWGLCANHDFTDWVRGSVASVTSCPIGRQVEYRADWENDHEPNVWHPSIHMPLWASRLTLEITSIRVERLNDISEEDAEAEGVTSRKISRPWGLENGWSADWSRVGQPNKYAANGKTIAEEDIGLATARHAFCNLWESINGPGSWDANPWVWVVEFKRVMP